MVDLVRKNSKEKTAAEIVTDASALATSTQPGVVNHYEELSWEFNWSGAFTENTTIRIVRVGKQVTWYVPKINVASIPQTTSNAASPTYTGVVPNSLLPDFTEESLTELIVPVWSNHNGTIQLAYLKFDNRSGHKRLRFYSDISDTNFTVGNTFLSGINTFSFVKA